MRAVFLFATGKIKMRVLQYRGRAPPEYVRGATSVDPVHPVTPRVRRGAVDYELVRQLGSGASREPRAVGCKRGGRTGGRRELGGLAEGRRFLAFA